MIITNNLVNAKELVNKAKNAKYAVPHININSLLWAKNVLEAAQEENSPVIIGASVGAIKYMGGFSTVANGVISLVNDLKITVPVALHLDHGNYDSCFKAIDAGFTSVMFDGSSMTFDENYSKTAEIVKYAKDYNVSVEAEVGSIGGQEDDMIFIGELASSEEALKMQNLGIDFLAAGIGNIHGPYPENWKSLNFDKLKELNKALNIGLVLHGGSGIPKDQIKKAIKNGVAKINVNTELQLSFCDGLKEFILSGKVNEGKNYDPRKLLKDGFDNIKKTVKEIIHEFGSSNKI
ncbi:class II fructose-1,6-bisphosphate aldolase [Mycoplasmopsis felifaucium]|uniref:class II fructose-1,6-bisphosphate aldolase n=1 Tax=Mycoplasmopsis felifaucium TaxID=35768 RepID=UPI000481B384|nr:class II fructose-1,6-bisphosphate aldolase [Mycoplasmopsis felifaucium]